MTRSKFRHYQHDGNESKNQHLNTNERINPNPHNKPEMNQRKKEPLFCICRKPDDHSFMIQCNFCDEWYHPNCVNLDLSIVPKLKEYKCSKCLSMEKKKHENKEIETESETRKRNHKDKEIETERDRERQGKARHCNKSKSPIYPLSIPISSSLDQRTDYSNSNYSESKDTIRINVIENFKSILSQYFKGKSDQCVNLATLIELALFNVYSESIPTKYSQSPSFSNSQSSPSSQSSLFILTKCGSNYRSKCRSLQYNLNDFKNNRLREKLFNGEISVDKLVTMSSSEMANEELEKKIIEVRKRSIEQSTISSSSSSSFSFDNNNLFNKKMHGVEELIPISSSFHYNQNQNQNQNKHSHLNQELIKKDGIENSLVNIHNHIDHNDDYNSNQNHTDHDSGNDSNDSDNNKIIWNGFIILPDVCRFKSFIPNNLFYDSINRKYSKFIPFTLYVTGKLNVDVALDYLHKIHSTSTSRFIASFIIFPQESRKEKEISRFESMNKINQIIETDNDNQDQIQNTQDCHYNSLNDYRNSELKHESEKENDCDYNSISMNSLVSFLLRQDKVGVIRTDPNGPIKDCYLFIQDSLIKLKNAVNNLIVIDESLLLTEVCMVLVMVIQKYHYPIAQTQLQLQTQSQTQNRVYKRREETNQTLLQSSFSFEMYNNNYLL